MESFLKVYEDMINKLGRQLQKEEIQFLQWMDECYKKEQKNKHAG